jgi:hypothetical protein
MTTLNEEYIRRSDGKDNGAILVTYAAPPEETVKDFIETCLPLTGIFERNLDIPIIYGHPMFQEGISKEGIDGLLPKIGVEWARDTRVDYLGMNEKHFKGNDSFFEFLNSFNQKPDTRRMPSENFLKRFSEATHFQQFQHTVKSEVVITGFASGNVGRKVSQWMYEAIDGILSLMVHDLPILHQGLGVLIYEDSETNLSSSDFAMPIFGFEVKVILTQVRTTFRTKPSYLFPEARKFDVHLKDSKSKFGGSFGLETYGRP